VIVISLSLICESENRDVLRLVVLAGSLAALASASLLPGFALAADLAARDIRDRLVGQTIRWWAEDSFLSGDLVLAEDGRAELTVRAPESRDHGTWWLADGRLCTRWAAERDGAEKCYALRPLSDRRFVTTGGNVFELLDPET
jgi:hypothetical protein